MHPRSLKIDGREVFVETTPLETQVAGFQARTLHRAGRQRLVLKPSLGSGFSRWCGSCSV
jgi:hypothetical protein